MANLRKVLEWLSENLAPKFLSESEAMSLTPLPPLPLPGNCTSGAYFLPYQPSMLG